MSDRVSRRRKEREKDLEVGRFRFTIRRPNGEEISTRAGLALVKYCVVNWSGVRECDLLKSGVQDEIPFNREEWEDWIADRPDLWGVISKAINKEYEAYAKRLEDAEKK